MCKTKNTVDYLQGTPPKQEEYDFDSVEFELDPIETPVFKEENKIFSSKQYPSTNVNLKINGVKVLMKIDSGSEVNVIGQDVYQQILNNSQKKITLQKSKAKLKPYNSQPLQIRGKFRAIIESRKHTTTADIYIAASNNVKSILSKYSAFDMNICKFLWRN